MARLLIIADDFTGALDTGIQFAEAGISTKVVVGEDVDFSRAAEEAQVLVVDTETRHMQAERAYDVVFSIVEKAVLSGVEIVYKKTDSALRGCVGAELSAVLDASKQGELYFLPALPDAGRTTVGGTQFVLGVPVHQSVFGKDPFEPVKHSYIPDIIGNPAGVQVVTVASEEQEEALKGADGEGKKIFIFDAQTNEDLKRTGSLLRKTNRLKVLAGCAGFASVLPELIDFQKGEIPPISKTDGLFVVCGSLNPITKRQLEHAERNGFSRISVSPELYGDEFIESAEGRTLMKRISRLSREGTPLILDSLGKEDREQNGEARGELPEELRSRVAKRMGEMTVEWLKLGLNHTVFLTGGDTLLGFMEQAGCMEIKPLMELFQGVVLSELSLKDRTLKVISKSGGFGHDAIFTDIADRILSEEVLAVREA